MTDKQRAAIERHGRELLAIFPDATERDPVKLCKRLRRLEGEARRHAERMCSDADYVETVEADDVEHRLRARLCKLLGSDRPWINRDPRGYALKVDLGERSCPDCREGYWTGYPLYANSEPIRVRCDKCSGSGKRPERLATDWGGLGILAPEIGPEGE